jgi:hypothetical protein
VRPCANRSPPSKPLLSIPCGRGARCLACHEAYARIRANGHGASACSDSEGTMNFWLDQVKKEQSQLTFKNSAQIDAAV